MCLSQETWVSSVLFSLQGPQQSFIRKYKIGPREMVQRIRELAILPKDPGSVSSTHTTAHNHL